MTEFFDKTLGDYPRLKNENNDSPRIQRAINETAGGVLYIPRGNYEIAEPVYITGFTSLLLHKAAVLTAVCEMDFILIYDGEKQLKEGEEEKSWQRIGMFIKGGVFNGDGKASCVAISGVKHFTLSDIIFMNGKRYGLRTGETSKGYEIIANNLYCKCDISGLAGNIGISCNIGDSHYTDCVVVDYTVGMDITEGSCRLTRCHVWGGLVPALTEGGVPEMLENSICFNIHEESCNDTFLEDCYADTGKTGFRVGSNTRLIGCSYLNAPVFVLDDIAVIDHHWGYLRVDSGFFRVCTEHGVLYRGNNKNVSWGDNYIEGREMYKPEKIGG